VPSQSGKLKCEVCDFDFEDVYGTLGKSFCEVHHKTPISANEIEVETKLEDLAIICSNCHRIIHRTKPMLNLNEFIALLKNEA
jgi:5-methylcytosine-specific restriction protein A